MDTKTDVLVAMETECLDKIMNTAKTFSRISDTWVSMSKSFSSKHAMEAFPYLLVTSLLSLHRYNILQYVYCTTYTVYTVHCTIFSIVQLVYCTTCSYIVQCASCTLYYTTCTMYIIQLVRCTICTLYNLYKVKVDVLRIIFNTYTYHVLRRKLKSIDAEFLDTTGKFFEVEHLRLYPKIKQASTGKISKSSYRLDINSIYI